MTTLRSIMTKPLPSLDEPHMIPNPDPNHDQYHNYIENPLSNDRLVDELIQECAIWVARVFADSYTYQSDSTIDSHNAMLCTLENMNGLIYGNDQTMSTAEAIDAWLDDDDAAGDLAESANPNTGISDELNANRPRLFEYFNLDFDSVWGDN